MNQESKTLEPNQTSATTQDIQREAGLLRTRIQEHHLKIQGQHGDISSITRRCAYFEAVMDDIENNRISGPDHALAGLVDTARELCEVLDAVDGKAIAKGSRAIQ